MGFFKRKKKGFFKEKKSFKNLSIFTNGFFFHLEGEGFGFLPVEVRVFTSKMSIRRCFLENWLFQIQIPKDEKQNSVNKQLLTQFTQFDQRSSFTKLLRRWS